MRRIALVILLLAMVNPIFAQLFEKIYYVSGKLLEEGTNKPVAYALVININKGNLTQTDTAGRFVISVTKNDTLKFSVLGYEPAYFTLSDKDVKGRKYKTDIYISKKVYPLPKVNIFEERWKAFVYEVAHTEVEKDKTQEELQSWFSKIIAQEDLQSVYMSSRGVGLINISGKTKYEKQLAKMKQLQNLEQIQKRAEEKFNPQIVSAVTGLQGEELYRFMDFLNFDRDFILKTSEYDLITIIKQIYDEYKKGNLYKRDEILNSAPFTPRKDIKKN